MTPIENLPFDFAALRAAYADGLAPARVMAEVVRRIDVHADPGVFLHLPSAAELMAEARALGGFDPARPLWGLPFAVKDNIDVAGWPTTAACPAFAYDAEVDAEIVARLRAAGAIPVGKTNLDQFATGLVGLRTPFPAPRNALDPAIVPGGSSSGSAVAVAAGLVAFALGTDTAGSGRVPAALNNIVGLKPSLGALSARGIVPACRTLDTASVFALSVADAYAAFEAAAGFDPRDPFSRAVPVARLGAPPPRLTIGVPSPGSIRFDGDLAQGASFREARARLNDLGARLVEIDFAPLYEIAALLYQGPWVAERHAVVEGLLAADPEAIEPTVRGIISGAKNFSATDAFRGRYRLADLARRVEPTLAAVDLVCVPSIPRFVTVSEARADPLGPNALLGTYTNFVNLLGLCALAVPTPARVDGRPGGVTLIAAAGRDGLLASLGQRIEAWGSRSLGATGWRRPAAPAPATGPGEGEMEIAVCGAHMSGLPLNGELTRLGGRFLRAAETTPDYRLYALPGGPPRRPGLLRATGRGGAVSLEVWALPRAALGGFVAGVPAPLGFGRVALADGTAPFGFLVEAAGVAGADDVTGLGGWRAVLAASAEATA